MADYQATRSFVDFNGARVDAGSELSLMRQTAHGHLVEVLVDFPYHPTWVATVSFADLAMFCRALQPQPTPPPTLGNRLVPPPPPQIGINVTYNGPPPVTRTTRCECGANATGQPKHADWNPKCPADPDA